MISHLDGTIQFDEEAVRNSPQMDWNHSYALLYVQADQASVIRLRSATFCIGMAEEFEISLSRQIQTQ